MAIIKMYLSAGTQTVINDDVDKTIKKWSKYYKVEEALVRAVCEQESQYVPFALRYESHLKRAKWYLATIPDRYKDDKYAYCSMGYMQVLFGTARSYGFKGTPHDLLSADNSIRYGVRHLAQLIKSYYNIERVISAYNQGTPKKSKATGKFHNQSYVNSVLKYYKRFGGRVSIR